MPRPPSVLPQSSVAILLLVRLKRELDTELSEGPG